MDSWLLAVGLTWKIAGLSRIFEPLMKDKVGSKPCLGSSSRKSCLGTCSHEPCLGTSSWEPCLGRLGKATGGYIRSRIDEHDQVARPRDKIAFYRAFVHPTYTILAEGCAGRLQIRISHVCAPDTHEMRKRLRVANRILAAPAALRDNFCRRP